jgi:hypothetical protein
VKIVAVFRLQASACDELGSPLYGDLLRRIIEDYEFGGPSVAVLAGHEDDPGHSALALRLLGSVHRLVLAGELPELAAFYPSVGGEWDPVLGWEAFEQALVSRRPEVRALLDSPPQTNEVGRSAALYGGLLRLAREIPLPVRLFEIGSSAGLNLRADHFRYDAGPGFGPIDSPVRFAAPWAGRVPVEGPEPVIVERTGSDIAPIDPFDADGELTLTAYVWPDQAERLSRLRGALEVARKVPADVHREDAVSFLRAIEPAAGQLTLVWHSVMWQYLTAGDKAAAEEAMEDLGARATVAAPVARLAFEPGRRTPGADREFLVVLWVWPGGERRVLGAGAPHGIPISWD